MGLWDIGGQWVLRDQLNDASVGNDLMTQKFLRAQPSHKTNAIPLVPVMLELSRPADPLQLTLMSQARGDRLMLVGFPLFDSPLGHGTHTFVKTRHLSYFFLKHMLTRLLPVVWRKLSAAQKASYLDQMAALIQQLRQFTAPHTQKVDGTPLDDLIIGHCIGRRAPTCFKIGATADAWLDALEPSLRAGLTEMHQTTDPAIIEAKLVELRANFPSGGPYYLTHGDLNFSNIIVKDDKIEAILDWEMAGYYPWWAELNQLQ
jgi:hypothetical protein